ncbi:GvpL/GvpF family gas vesicle protein [Desulfoscipio geothermicus]|uniref:Gas vesicle synthesis protein GvpL/GvpF n=1 Tax=Desulfoscipio geothermicus DSM 3669 TaxID=1121426 RepID=A0A1I6CZ96_9FIRM|nr:GvpL/GvpF family gas vesicle protein [Desulfoscipio geothermicus]SFQ98559.1 Gas vesicle synthesis protein GvpL/GvpF [Desulfoscipio geothermicus DSM 3669]
MIYLYGVIDYGEAFSFTVHGSGRKIFNLAVNGLGMVVSPAGAEDGKVLSQNILAHNTVMEYLMDRFTVLPVRFGTLVSGENEARKLLVNYRSQFARQLKRLHGKVEMGVKVLWNTEQVLSGFRESEILGELKLKNLESDTPGHKFLFRKYREKAPEMYLERKAVQIADQIHEPLARQSLEARRHILRTPALILSGAYLLDRENVSGFRGEFLHLKRNFSDYNFLMSGPWPPYNFFNLTCIAGGESI